MMQKIITNALIQLRNLWCAGNDFFSRYFRPEGTFLGNITPAITGFNKHHHETTYCWNTGNSTPKQPAEGLLAVFSWISWNYSPAVPWLSRHGRRVNTQGNQLLHDTVYAPRQCSGSVCFALVCVIWTSIIRYTCRLRNRVWKWMWLKVVGRIGVRRK